MNFLLRIRTVFATLLVLPSTWSILWAEGADIPPTFSNVSYGPRERNVLDFWQASADTPTALVVQIHGGGWAGGDKEIKSKSPFAGDLLRVLLQRGVSVASINYRYSTIAPLPAPVHDAARAIQFLRLRAADWKIDPARIAAMGVSAGGCTALWLAYHDDLADPTSPDPVARQSTRLTAALGFAPQTSIDAHVLTDWVGAEVLQHGMIAFAVGLKGSEEIAQHYGQVEPLYREFSPINHVTKDDPPVMVVYATVGKLPAPDRGAAIHHAVQGFKLKEKADRAGAVCFVRITDQQPQGMMEPSAFLLNYLAARP